MSKLNVMDTAERLVQFMKRRATREGRSRLEDFHFYSGYSEPGYNDPESGVICLGNFNTVSRYDQELKKCVTIDDAPARCAGFLEKLGIELEWCDEWASCGECGKLVRTQGNSYRWTPSYVIMHSDFLCESCVDVPAYLEELEGNDSSALTIDADPEDHGYTLWADDFENGLYGGQSADPRKIGAALRKRGVTRYLFRIDSVGQFDMDFSVYVHDDEIGLLQQAEPLDSSETDGFDPAVGLQRALQQGSVQQAGLQGQDGIVVTKCDLSTGTADTKVVSPQDFLEGRALD